MKLIKKSFNKDIKKFKNEENQIKYIAKLLEKRLPVMEKKIKIFARQNTQSSLSMMSLTMLNGKDCPYRLLRQILAEVETRKLALYDAQYSYASTKAKLDKLNKKQELTEVESARKMKLENTLELLEEKINGTLRDLAVLSDSYDRIQKNYNIPEDWDEEDVEREEKFFHVRRGFELLYKNMLEYSRPADSTIEYLMQWGIHPQVAIREVKAYIQSIEKTLDSAKCAISENSLEDFLTSMAKKYLPLVDDAVKRLFGDSYLGVKDVMLLDRNSDKKDE